MPIDIGAYRVDGELTPVGNGQVSVATETATGRTCFIKVFDKYVMPTDEALATGHRAVLRRRDRFEAYERRLKTINERLRTACGSTGGLVCATDFFRDGCRLAKVTDYVEFDKRPVEQLHEAYTREQVDQVFRSALTSVQTLHGQGIVHGDLKPDNIFVCRDDDGCVGRVSDFDDSFFADAVPDACDVTSTLEYYSPELARYVRHAEDPDDPLGKSGSELACAVGRTHDIFALGLVLHVYLTGALPQVRGGKGYVFEALLAHGDAGIRLDPGLSPRDAALIRWMLRCDPRRRPQTCVEVLNALNADGRGIPAVRVPVAADDGDTPLRDLKVLLVLHGAPVAEARGTAAGRALLKVPDVSPDRYEVQVAGRTGAGKAVEASHVVRAAGDAPAEPVCFHFEGGRAAKVDAVPFAPGRGCGPAAGGFVARGRAVRGEERTSEGGCTEEVGTETKPLGYVLGRLSPKADCATAPKKPAGDDEVSVQARTRRADIVFDPPRDGRYVSLTKVEGGRVLIRMVDGTAWCKPLRELALFGMRDCIERLGG